jgi:hypothetical protein
MLNLMANPISTHETGDAANQATDKPGHNGAGASFNSDSDTRGATQPLARRASKPCWLRL